MDAGRDLDALVAEKVLGWRHIKWERTTPLGRSPKNLLSLVLEEVPYYSTDIAAAWQVVERMRSTIVSKRQNFLFYLVEVISARIFPNGAHNPRIDMSQIMLHVQPVDICIAALKAVGYEQT